ncbi:Ankyrin repeat and LEM domain-containing protein 2 [Aphelenchoides fujianensis]|nr:Ankyrin repeat and LEM domain-containing protein 2 [Aphelenchoides fujianensis]
MPTSSRVAEMDDSQPLDQSAGVPNGGGDDERPAHELLDPTNARSPVFAAYIPNSPQRHVFREFKELKEFLNSPECKKLNTSARFKRCRNSDELDSFYTEVDELNQTAEASASVSSSSVESSGEFKSKFPAPAAREANFFRLAIESKNNEKFEELLAANPRYLLNTAIDAPTILHNQRYNALHVACQSGNVYVVERVLKLLQDEEFLENAYGPNNYAPQRDLIEGHLLDGFLNTPDKSANNTPLHFAARGGFAEIAEKLVAFPACMRDRPNNFGKTPFDMICTSFKGTPAESAAAKKQLKKLLLRKTGDPLNLSPPSPSSLDFAKLKLSTPDSSFLSSPVSSRGPGGDAKKRLQREEQPMDESFASEDQTTEPKDGEEAEPEDPASSQEEDGEDEEMDDQEEEEEEQQTSLNSSFMSRCSIL